MYMPVDIKTSVEWSTVTPGKRFSTKYPVTQLKLGFSSVNIDPKFKIIVCAAETPLCIYI